MSPLKSVMGVTSCLNPSKISSLQCSMPAVTNTDVSVATRDRNTSTDSNSVTEPTPKPTAYQASMSETRRSRL